MATVTTLVPAPITGISEANGINNAGSVVGQEDLVFPFVWQPQQPNGTAGAATRLPILPTGGGPGEATAFAISNSDEITGVSDGLDPSGNAVRRAVLWQNGVIFDLGTLIPDPQAPGGFLGSSRGIDINDSGVIVGESDSPLGISRAFSFNRATATMNDLGALAPGGASRATSINNNGDIVGVSDALDAAGNVVDHAFLLPAGAVAMIDLGTLLLDPANPGFFLETSGAFGINDNGDIIGSSDAGGGLSAAVRFFNGSLATPLLPMHSNGFDIGPNGDLVGTFGANLDQGFASTLVGAFQDLSALTGSTITSATGVNATGQITAIASVGGNTVGVLITP